jgi:hypothetical protein
MEWVLLIIMQIISSIGTQKVEGLVLPTGKNNGNNHARQYLF